MDVQLKRTLHAWHDQIEKLRQVEEKYLQIAASEKTMYSQLFLKAEGKTVADKEASVYTSKDWVDFARGFAAAKVEYNFCRRELDLKQKAFDAAYLSCKQEHEAIKKDYR